MNGFYSQRIAGQWFLMKPLGEKELCRDQQDAEAVAFAANVVHSHNPSVESLRQANRLLLEAGHYPAWSGVSMMVQGLLKDRCETPTFISSE